MGYYPKAVLRRLVLTAMAATATPAAALTIVPIWDRSVTQLSNASIVENAFNAAATPYEAVLPATATVYINVKWGNPSPNGLTTTKVKLFEHFSYNQVVLTLLRSTPYPIPSVRDLVDRKIGVPNPLFSISSAQLKALGYLVPGSSDGSITFNANSVTDFAYSAQTLTPTLYDFQAVASHQIAKILGQFSGLDKIGVGERSLLDLYRYNETRIPGGGSGSSFNRDEPAYFSLDGGTSVYERFNTTNGGDRGDWSNVSAGMDVNDAFISKGEHHVIRSVDYIALDAIGWSGPFLASGGAGGPVIPPAAAVPEPASWALMLGGFGLLGGAMRRRTASERARTAN